MTTTIDNGEASTATFTPDDGIYRLYYQSDFTLAVNGIDFPDYDFTVELFTDGSSVFTASYIDGTATNIANADGVIHIIADGHGLGSGTVIARLTRHIPDTDYPDGYRTVVDEAETDVELVVTAAMPVPGEDGETVGGITGTLVSPFDTPVLVTEDEEYYIVTETTEQLVTINT